MPSKARTPGSYAITGTRRWPDEATVAPPANLVAYSRSVIGLAEELDLVPNDTSPNIVLLQPLSDVVFERTRTCAGLTCVAISQAAIDLLTAPAAARRKPRPSSDGWPNERSSGRESP